MVIINMETHCQHFLHTKCKNNSCPYKHDLEYKKNNKSLIYCKSVLNSTKCSHGSKCFYNHNKLYAGAGIILISGTNLLFVGEPDYKSSLDQKPIHYGDFGGKCGERTTDFSKVIETAFREYREESYGSNPIKKDDLKLSNFAGYWKMSKDGPLWYGCFFVTIKSFNTTAFDDNKRANLSNDLVGEQYKETLDTKTFSISDIKKVMDKHKAFGFESINATNEKVPSLIRKRTVYVLLTAINSGII